MNAVNQTANCVNSSTGPALSLQQRIIALIEQGRSNSHIVDLTGAQAAYVRAVRSRFLLYHCGVKRRQRASRRPRRRPAQTRAELRVLALKLYEIRQGGLL